MKLSVVICTCNRPALLSATLASLCDVEPPSAAWEVIVVSNDGAAVTRDIARASMGRLPLRLVEEPRIGASHARNRAVSEAKGEYIIWTDDDVLYDRGFLHAYESAIAARPDAVILGGTILPLLQGSPPAWLEAALPVIEGAYAARRPKHHLGAIEAGSGNVPYGANFAVRAAEQRRQLYDPALGARPGGRMIDAEEVPVIEALLSKGHPGIWVPGAIVHHVMPPHRQTLAYLRRYFEGRGWQLAQGRPRRPSLRRRLSYRMRVLCFEALLRGLRLTAAPPVWMDMLKRSATLTGQLRFDLAGTSAQASAGPVRRRRRPRLTASQ
jgi:glycosyltransferase involved in cell wall biosynthesis